MVYEIRAVSDGTFIHGTQILHQVIALLDPLN